MSVRVRVASVAQAEFLDRGLDRPHVPRDLRTVHRLHQQRDLDVGQRDFSNRPIEKRRRAFLLGRRDLARRGERLARDDEVGVGGPREVVDVFLFVGIGRGAVRVLSLPGPLTRGADAERLRHGHLDGVASVVGVELGVGVELMAVPAAGFTAAAADRLVDGDLRKPLADEIEVPGVAGAREDASAAAP